VIVDIIRLEEDYQFGTFGIMRLDGTIFCATLEPPDRLNKKNVSSIPAKSYQLKRFYSPHFNRELFRVLNVPGRTGVEIHAGNKASDTEGCIMLGEHIEKLRGPNRAIKNSGATLQLFMAAMEPYRKSKLIIREMY